jgi:pimeloyl-ACP methyl ester carboxylesterase
VPRLTTADGRTLAWNERGSGPPLLCHPGGPGCSSAYYGDLPQLAAERTLILLDPRGTGASDPPADPAGYDLEDYADDVEAVQRHLGIERLDLLGHSHGGFVAMTWAARYPERVGRLVLANTAPRFTDAIRGARQARVASHEGQPYYEDSMEAMRQRAAGRYSSAEELGELYRREGLLEAPVGVDPTPVLDVLARAGDNADALGHFNSRIAGGMDHRPLLAGVPGPVLVITGSEDAFLSGSYEIAEALPNATLVVLPGADHFPYLEPGHAEPWSRAVLDFLRR